MTTGRALHRHDRLIHNMCNQSGFETMREVSMLLLGLDLVMSKAEGMRPIGRGEEPMFTEKLDVSPVMRGQQREKRATLNKEACIY